jgi:8-oxo-dGTP pyrophosphatase MutT (NUDIX family)
MQDKALFFHYCPKQIIFSKDLKTVLLAKRTGEADYDGMYTFIGGKTETTDGSLVGGLIREKDEEIGKDAKLKICVGMSCYQVWYRKKNGNYMILPHHVAIFQGGEITLNNDEYATYAWVPVGKLRTVEPLLPEVEKAVFAALRMLPILVDSDFVTI